MSLLREAYTGIRQPEYTGENRCIPCTVTNLVITAIIVVGLSIISIPVAIAVAILGVGSIWLRGYLVPKTPELTKRYFPEWLLAKFDKQSTTETVPVPDDNFDPEEYLVSAEVVEPCEHEDDLCLTTVFERDWNNRMEKLEEEASLRGGLAEQLDLDPETVTFDSYGDAFVARNNGTRVGQWESRAALIADLAAATELPEWIKEWDRLSPQQRSHLLGGLRVFVETCPTCGGPVTADTEVVESCCRSTTVVGVGCEDCGDRLLEVPYDEAPAS